jgi:leader peptidase (prepilin peptidase)/N-methyltransferase
MIVELIELLSNSPVFYLCSVGVLGLLFGSFFNVVIYRLPRMMKDGWSQQCEELLEIENRTDKVELSLLSPGSNCPHCSTPIRSFENIPVLSYLFLGGRCRHCKTRISWRYPFVELLTAAMFVVTAWVFGFSYQALAGLILTGLLVPLIFIDIDEQILPDNVTLAGVWIGLAFNSFGVLTDLQSAVFGAMAGYLSLWCVYWAFKLLTGKEGMGYGDFKLLAMLGAWLGWQFLPLIILLSASVGAVIGIVLLALGNKARDTPIPFGPYLCLAGWIALVKGDVIVSAYLQISGLR